ncbi:50S ribosomal protein L5 [Candidatus Woesearchaeota archaeon]|nr:50S ribosomal protein L5 [Nanoarchaeota archaeon]MCB9369980.1 50S ribosomal protein L5 [Candidatus Woesearchaeota archaeon]USN44516.1 MAG: 50S ribosomal protein L5 [Candidatus Woesearchaeota archaeon]
MTKEAKINPMKVLLLDKVTINVCVGNDKQGMDRAEKLLRKLTNKTPVTNRAKKRLATWQIRPGLPIGYKVTLRGDDAKNFLKWILESKGKKFKSSSLDINNNFSIGFHEYLDLNGIKYDSEIGIMGFEIMVTFTRPGYRVKLRNLKKARIPQRHKVSREEVLSYVKNEFGVSIE